MARLPSGSRDYSTGNKARVRKLRREMSISERTLWAWLRNKRLGFVFRTQHPVDNWVLDFYCPEARLCVEVDGEQHGLTRDRDATRDAELDGIGVMTLRIPSLDLFTPTGAEFSKWIREIVRLCEERTGRVVWPNGIQV